MSGNDASPAMFSLAFCCVTIGIMLVLFAFLSGCTDTTKDGIPSPAAPSSLVVVQDSLNETYSFQRPVERIVALNLDTIETLIVLGAGDKIVGVPEYLLTKTHLQKYIPHAVSVGDSGTPAVEVITSLNPDVVIIMGSSQDSVKSQLENLNIPVLSYNCYILSDIPCSVKNLGILTGNENNATRYLDYFSLYDSMIQERIGNTSIQDRPRVYLEIGSEFTAAGPGSGGDSLLCHMKAHNIASNLSTEWPKVTAEWIIKTDPDYIVKTVHTYAGEEKNFTAIYNEITNREGFPLVSACMNDRVYVITSNILYGPKGILGQILLGKLLYPEKFTDITFEDVVSQYEDVFGIQVQEKEILYPVPWT